jgi:hypothetical protein
LVWLQTGANLILSKIALLSAVPCWLLDWHWYVPLCHRWTRWRTNDWLLSIIPIHLNRNKKNNIVMNHIFIALIHCIWVFIWGLFSLLFYYFNYEFNWNMNERKGIQVSDTNWLLFCFRFWNGVNKGLNF